MCVRFIAVRVGGEALNLYFSFNLHKNQKTEIICTAKSDSRVCGRDREGGRVGRGNCNRSASAVTSVKASQVF